MYRRPKFLEVLIEIRQEMAREADYDVDFFAELARSGRRSPQKTSHSLIDMRGETQTADKPPTMARKD